MRSDSLDLTKKSSDNEFAHAPEAVSEWATLRKLWPYIWPDGRPDLKMRVIWAMGLLLLAKVITVLVPYSYKWATDALATHNDSPAVWLMAPIMLVVAYGVAGILMVGFNQLRDALFARVGQHAVRALGRRTFTHMHELSLRFHLERRTGGLTRIIERGVKGIESIVRFTILNTLPTILELALMVVVIAYQFDWSYVLVLTLTIIAYVTYTVIASNWRMRIRKRMNDSDTQANSRAIDSLLNYETVKYFGNEAWETKRFDRSMARYEQAAVQTWTSLAWLNFGQRLIFTVGMILCMVFSAQAVMAGTQTLGDFVMINALLMQLAIPLNFIGFVYREIRQGIIDIETMFSILVKAPEIVDAPSAPVLQADKGEIQFENVVFAYENQRPILNGISFTVPAGKTVAVVGPSGAGKSTISRILFRFYDIQSGRVLIDGQDIAEVQQYSLRAVLGMVPQDTVLFNDSLAYNIRYGRPDASDQDIDDAVAMAQLEEFVGKLPDGLHTQVGERGLKLSGGEKQRVAIARTLLKAPPILVLDEATSALDTNTEREIQAALDQVSRNRTSVVIAHRLSTIINADEILVLENGRIKERGTHEDLLRQGELYAEMWRRQQEAAAAIQRLKENTEYLPA